MPKTKIQKAKKEFYSIGVYIETELEIRDFSANDRGGLSIAKTAKEIVTAGIKTLREEDKKRKK